MSTGNTTLYAGNYIYENTGGGDELKFFNHAEGYIEPKNPTNYSLGFAYIYQYKDHLGNIRLSYKNTGTTGSPTLEIQEENHYYPFGLKHKGYNSNINSTSIALKKKFGGKEYQDELGLGWYDITARNYDPALGRWMNIDPLSEMMTRHSPYNYAFNNPVYFIDADGMAPTGAYGESLEDCACSWSSSDPDDWDYYVSEDNSYENCPECKTFEDYYNYYSAYIKSPVVQEKAKKGLEDTGIGLLKGLIQTVIDVTGITTIRVKDVTASEKPGYVASIIIFALLEPGPGGESKLVTNVFDLIPTQYIKRSRREFDELVGLIRQNGITEPIEYAIKDGIKYIQRGHHRAYIAKRLGINNVPVKEVPYEAGMEIMEMGKNPGYLKHVKW